MLLHKKNSVVTGVTVLTLLIGCSSTTSTKQLNDANAKSMLAAKLTADNADIYGVDIANIRNAIKEPTLTDYYSANEPETLGTGFLAYSNPGAPVQRLVKAGYITQAKETRTIPDISGDYSATLKTSDGQKESEYRVTIATTPGSDQVSGDFLFTKWHLGSFFSWRGPITGSVDPSGAVHLDYGQTISNLDTPVTYISGSVDNSKTLQGSAPFSDGRPSMVLTAGRPPGKLAVTRYKYEFASNVKMLSAPHETEIAAGSITVDRVTNLLLSTDTVAQANFGWHVDLDGPARAITGKATQSGSGVVAFGKQPDGNWVVAGYQFQ